MKNVAESCSLITSLGQDQTGEISREWLKKPKEYFLMKNFKKLH